METGIRKTIDGYQVWFKIDNQTFHLDEHVEETDKDSLEVAKFFERMLKGAFEKLDINVVSQQRELFYNFITWYNAKPKVKKPKDGLITTNIIEDYLKL